MKVPSILLVALTLLLVFASLPTSAPPHQAPVILRGAMPSNSKISVLVESQHDLTSADIELLSRYGTITTVAGPIAVIHTEAARLDEMSRLPFIIRIEKSYPLSVELDQSVPDIGAPEVWDKVKDPLGRNVTGAGVILGFVDTGIDTTHPDFTFPNGSTKILYVWDQTTPGRPPKGFGYGFECTSSDIQARTCPEIDSFGHGTHVAGIATSSGMATGNYTGVAPGARIIFVKSGNEVCNGDSWTFSTDQIIDGINYITEKAALLRMRVVVNLSLGGNIGAHDGTDPFELALDAFVKSGTPIVVSAGNAAEDQDHIDGQISQGQNVTFQVQLKQTTTDVAIDVWYSPEDQISATFYGPNGTTYPVQTVPGGIRVGSGEVNTTAASFAHGNELYVEINSTTPLPVSDWRVSLIGTQIHSEGFWDAWTDSSTCTFPGSFFLPGNGYVIDPHDTIGIPGTAADVVTVGAYVTKTSWKGIDGRTYGQPNIHPGGIASFSSLGPTRDGRIKPDIVAPGEVIVSARSSAVPDTQSNPDAYHRVLAGTSMSAPHVAGTIALLLQYSPGLQATEIPGILRQTARLDSNTGLITSGSGTWGYGKVDARTATGFFRDTIVITGVPSTLDVAVHINDNEIISAPGGSWTGLYFLKGSTLTFSVDNQIQATDTRYEIQHTHFAENASSLNRLNYTTQYFLAVDSDYGATTGSGWYNANSTVTLGAPQTVPAQGVLGYLGAEHVLTYWVTDSGSTVSNPVMMEGPMTVTAVYTLTIPEQTFLEITILSIALVLLAVVFARKRLS